MDPWVERYRKFLMEAGEPHSKILECVSYAREVVNSFPTKQQRRLVYYLNTLSPCDFAAINFDLLHIIVGGKKNE